MCVCVCVCACMCIRTQVYKNGQLVDCLESQVAGGRKFGDMSILIEFEPES